MDYLKMEENINHRKKEYLLISYIISILLISILVLEIMMSKYFNVLSYHTIVLLSFLVMLFVSSKLLFKTNIVEHPSGKILFFNSLFVILITYLIYYNINAAEDLTDIIGNKHYYKIYYFIPTILYTIHFGKRFGLFTAIFSGLNLLFLNYLLNDFSILEIDLILISTLIWVSWLTSGYIEMEQTLQVQLKESQELFRLNFAEAHIGMIICDVKGNCIKVNKAICKMLNYNIEACISTDLTAFVHPDDLNKITHIFDDLIKGKKTSCNYEIRFLNKDGKCVWVNYNIAIVNPDNQPVYFLIQIEDITQKKIYEEKMQKQKEMLEYNKLKTRFFSKLSHELKTPINIIFTTLQMINSKQQRCKLTENKLNNYLHIIKHNIYRLLRLVNNIIDLTKIDTDSYKLNLENINIVQLIEKIADSVKEYFIQYNRKLEFNTDIAEKIIACDSSSIERIMLNLLANAIKFTKPEDTIMVNVKDLDNYILISVKDNGIGIYEDKKRLIFEHFRQVDESFTRKAEGSGIGLSVSRSLVELHGGHIWVESEYGKGSEFIVQLPVKTIDKKSISKDYIPDNLIDKINIEFSDIYNPQ
jgi:PAS domain S-box-containing protein